MKILYRNGSNLYKLILDRTLSGHFARIVANTNGFELIALNLVSSAVLCHSLITIVLPTQ